MKPLIGITAAHRAIEDGRLVYSMAYMPNIISIERAGGIPIVIPSGLNNDTLRALYERVDGVLLPGGGDVDPAYYNAERHPKTGNIDDKRDAAELVVARWTVEDDRPLFGICRGVQTMNIALGGTLIQDIPSLVETQIVHDTPTDLPRDHLMHDVHIASSTRLADIIGEKVTVNSHHHQSIEQPGQYLNVTAHAPDGVIEAIEMPHKRFVLGVQWHPEDLGDDAVTLRLFGAFIEAAGEFATTR